MSRLVVATSFPIDPPRGGGQARIRGLYGAVAAAGVPVDVVAFVARDERPLTHELQPGLREVRVPKSAEHHEAELQLQLELGVPASDLALGFDHQLTPAFGEALRSACDGAAAAVASHPFAYPALRDAVADTPLIYEAHNVEVDLKRTLLSSAIAGGSPAAIRALDAVRDWESGCCAEAELVIACSQQDIDRLAELYGVGPGPAIVVPNGCACEEIVFTGPGERAANRRALGIDGLLALFVGSWHGPNLEAARSVLNAAVQLPDARFLLLGSAGLALGDDLPANVDAPGQVHERFLAGALSVADVALNPMQSGSGTNLKMLQYASAGVPIISTEFGARGLAMVAGEHYAPCRPDGLAEALGQLAQTAPHVVAARVGAAREHVAARFDWRAVAAAWLQHPAMERILQR